MRALQQHRAPVRGDVPELVPARMLNEHAYCPRLAYLEWVQGDFADSADTVERRFHHRNVDIESGALPAPDELEGARFHARSVMLSAPRIGLIARIDLIEAEGDVAVFCTSSGRGNESISRSTSGFARARSSCSRSCARLRPRPTHLHPWWTVRSALVARSSRSVCRTS